MISGHCRYRQEICRRFLLLTQLNEDDEGEIPAQHLFQILGILFDMLRSNTEDNAVIQS